MKKRIVFCVFFLLSNLFLCSCTKPYDGDLVTIPFGLSYGMTLEEVKDQLEGYQYEEEIKLNGKYISIIITDNLNNDKFSRIYLNFYTYKADDNVFRYAGVSDKISEDVTLFYKAEIYVSEEQGNIIEVAEKMKEQDEEFGSTGDGPYQSSYLLDDIMIGGEKREKAGNVIIKMLEERIPHIISEQITLQSTDLNENVIIFDGNITAILNYLEKIL